VSAPTYAAHASPAFNAWMHEQCLAIAQAAREALGEDLVAIVLGGGYARGEGGVVRGPDGGEQPYNDVDFTIVVQRKEPGIAAALAPVSHRFEKVLGIDVDFSRPLTVEDIQRWPHWLMWTDLLAGHTVLLGPEGILRDNAPAALRESPPLIEATRLLLNRGAGVLWSLRVAQGLEAARDADFIRRNAHKCELAIGDSVILAARRHQVPYAGRDALLRECLGKAPEAAAFVDVDAYARALAFRLAPMDSAAVQPGVDALLALGERWRQALVHVESTRTGKAFAGAAAYAAWPGVREPAMNGLAQWPRNLARNAKLGRLSARHPRERLYRELPALLAGDGAGWPARSAAFLDAWRRFN
jgi:predicted nucleotidyltransferase